MVNFNAFDFAVPASAMAKIVKHTSSENYDDNKNGEPSSQKTGSNVALVLAMIILFVLWICLIVLNIRLIQKIPQVHNGPRIAAIILLILGIFNPVFLVISIIFSLFFQPGSQALAEPAGAAFLGL